MKSKYTFNITGFIISLIFLFIMCQVIIKTENMYLISVMVLGTLAIQFVFNRFINFDLFNREKGSK